MSLSYQVIHSARKTVAIQITQQGQIIVRAPNRMKDTQIAQFVESKSGWIEKHLPKRETQPRFSSEQIRALADRAMAVIPERVRYYAPMVGVTYGGITIRNQRTRWGSCSGKGNLNFNCLLMLTPPEVLDYVVVHELCHRVEMNHSPRFWAEVERVLPDYRVWRKWLSDNGGALIARL